MPCSLHIKRLDPFHHLPSGCQFRVTDDNLITVDHHKWCAFHCPMTDKQGNPTEKAMWDFEKGFAFQKEIEQALKEAREQASVLDYSGVVFPDTVDFRCTEFPSVLFTGATFHGIAGFDQAVFHGIARFDEAAFVGPAGFDETMFGGDTWFKSSGESNKDEQVNANVFHCVSFCGATFESDVSFENRQFLQATSFEGCTFKKAPEFHGCSLHQDTVFPPRSYFYDVTSKDAAQAYPTLKLAMEQVRARREEAMFYALEQESRRALGTTQKTEKLLSHLYQVSADYGESFLRPLGCLMAITALCFLLYVGLALASTKPGYHLQVCADFTMEQLVRPLSVWIKSGGYDMKELFKNNISLLVLKLLATLQALASLTFITLFILAVRRRFKLE